MSAIDGYRCDLCGGPDALPHMDHVGDPPGFTLYDQPALCPDCGTRWSDSTLEFRTKVRRHLGVVDDEDVA